MNKIVYNLLKKKKLPSKKIIIGPALAAFIFRAAGLTLIGVVIWKAGSYALSSSA